MSWFDTARGYVVDGANVARATVGGAVDEAVNTGNRASNRATEVVRTPEILRDRAFDRAEEVGRKIGNGLRTAAALGAGATGIAGGVALSVKAYRWWRG